MFEVLRTQDERASNCMQEPKKYFIQDLTLDGFEGFKAKKAKNILSRRNSMCKGISKKS